MLARTVAAALLASSASAGPVNEPLLPKSSWTVNYDTAQCTASRNYGADDDPLLLILRPSPLGKLMRMMVARKRVDAGAPFAMSATIQFDNQPRIDSEVFRSQVGKLALYSFTLPMKEFTAQERMNKVSISTQSLVRTFALSSIPAVLAELEKCRLDLLRMYHADGSGIRSPAKPARPLQKLFSKFDYPVDSTYWNEAGTVRVSLLIDEAGKVKNCSVEGTARAETLEAMTCHIIQERASFRPAIGTDGKPARSLFTQSIIWRI